MAHAPQRHPGLRRALFLGTALALVGGLLTGPLDLQRATGQTKKADPDPKKTEPGDPKKGDKSDVIVGGGVEQIAFINEQIEKKWKDNKIEPSERCSDYEFIRRASLDIVGRIAKPAEIREYMGWPADQRRSKLIDKLLNSKEYPENFANLWANLLMTRTGPPLQHMQMMVWLTDEFDKKNADWSKVVTSLLSATGKDNGDGDEPAVNFILAHLGDRLPGNPGENGQWSLVPVTSRITRLFLGLRTQCTQCHDHPFNDEWKQENFWGINAYLRQVEAPNGQPSAMKKKKDMPKDFHYILKDNPNFNVKGLVPYERRSGLVEVTKAFFLDGTKMPGKLEGTRRQELARKVTTSDYFGKAFVNRMWSHFMGRGFTKDVDDFGEHSRVSHPELLEKLGKDWAGKYQHNPRDLVRWICNSKAYGLSSRANKSNDKQDAEEFFSRMLLKSMTPEQLFESLMIATDAKDGQNREKKKELRDKWMNRLVVNFGDDEGNEGSFNGTVVQALLMMNGQEINDAILDENNGTMGLVLKNLKASKTMSKQALSEAIREMFIAALNRPPTTKELDRMLDPQRIQLDPMRPKVVDYAFAKEYCQDVFWALLNSNEFILNH
jgi:hypothetical protein